MNGEPLDLDAIEAKFWYRADDMNALIAECRALRAEVEQLRDVIEPPRPEWADRFGTVLLDRNGSAWQRGNYNWHRPPSVPSVSCTYEVLLDTYGPLTLLYDPAADHDETLDGAGMVKPWMPSPSFDATVPSEAWDITHPDHDDWGDMVGWCYADECTRHDRKPGSTA